MLIHLIYINNLYLYTIFLTLMSLMEWTLKPVALAAVQLDYVHPDHHDPPPDYVKIRVNYYEDHEQLR